MLALGYGSNVSAQKPHSQEWLCYMPMPVVRYNVIWLLEIWPILLQLRLMLHPRRVPRLALPGKGGPPGRSAR